MKKYHNNNILIFLTYLFRKVDDYVAISILAAYILRVI